MIRNFKYFIVSIFLATLIKGNAQDPQFSQFYSAPLYLAPSFAGSADGGRVNINYRNQWPSLTASYLTYALSADYYISKYKSGVGLLLLRDDAGGGLIYNTNLGLNYSYNFNINREWRFRPGLQAYYYWQSIDFNSLRFGDQILRGRNNPGNPGPSVEMEQLLNLPSVNHFDFTTSLLAYSEKYWFGFTLDHLMYFSNMLASQGTYLPQRYSVFGGGKFMIYGRTVKVKEESVSFAFNYFTQNKINYLDLGTYYVLEPLTFGLWYRGLPVFPGDPNVGAITFLLGYKFNEFRFGYSYDFTTSKLITRTGGAHELSLIYYFDERKRQKVKHKPLPCPVL